MTWLSSNTSINSNTNIYHSTKQVKLLYIVGRLSSTRLKPSWFSGDGIYKYVEINENVFLFVMCV